MDRLLRNVGGKITVTLEDPDGEPVDADDDVLVTIRDGAGAVVVADQIALDEEGTGNYGYAVSGSDAPDLDNYSATWDAAIDGDPKSFETHYAVVGNFYFSIGEAKEFDNAAMADLTAKQIRKARQFAESRIENILLKESGYRTAWVPRGERVTRSGSNEGTLYLTGRPIKEVALLEIGGAATDLDNVNVFSDRLELIVGLFSSGDNNVSVYYHYGHDQPTEEIKWAALILTKHRALSSNIEDRATSFSDELGTRQLAVPGRRGEWTGIPEVDSILKDAMRRESVYSIDIRT